MKIEKYPSAKKSYEDKIDKLGKEIEKKIARYRKHEISH